MPFTNTMEMVPLDAAHPEQHLASSPTLIPKPRIGIGVIGIGLRGQHSYEQLLRHDPRIRIVAVSSYPGVREELREGRSDDDDRRYAQSLGADYHGEDYASLLARPDIQLISLMCEPDRALELSKACFAAGKHVFRDKHLTLTAADAAAMHAESQRTGYSIMVALPLRHNAPLIQAREQVQSGAIGDLLAVTMSYVWASGPLDNFHANLAYAAAYGGGDVGTAGMHAVDVLNWLVGKRALSVYAEQGTFFYDDYKQAGMEDFGQLMIRYEDDVLVTLITGRIPKRSGEYAWLDITGSRGSLEVRRLSSSLTLEGTTPDTISLSKDPLQRMCGLAVDAMLTHQPMPSDARDGARALAVLEAARRSHASGRVESITEWLP